MKVRPGKRKQSPPAKPSPPGKKSRAAAGPRFSVLQPRPQNPASRHPGQAQLQELQASFESVERKCNHYANLYDFAPVGYAIFDAEGRIQDINKPGAIFLGLEHARLVGQLFAAFIEPESLPRFQQHLQRCRTGVGRINTELNLRSAKGVPIPIELVSAPFQSLADNLTQYRSALIDISQRRRAELELRRVQQNYESLVNALDGIVWEARFNKANGWNFVFVSSQAERLLGYPAENWIHQAVFWESHLHPDDKPTATATRERALREGRNYRLEYRLLTADQKPLWLRDNVTLTPLPGGQLKLQGLSVNISGLKEAEHAIRKTYDELEARVLDRTLELTRSYEELQHAMEERARLEQELLDITERERHRIALDLHDDLGQRLTGLSLMLKSLQVKLSRRNAPEAEEALKLHEVVSQTITRAHDLTHELGDWHNCEQDLLGALKELARRAEQLFNTRCQVRTAGSVPPLDPRTTNQLYKIAQEATTNAIKHGQARSITLHVLPAQDRLLLRVTSDGKPFPKLLNHRAGFGLRIMQYRANLVGATLDIRPHQDGGTQVTCTLKLPSGPARPGHET